MVWSVSAAGVCAGILPQPVPVPFTHQSSSSAGSTSLYPTFQCPRMLQSSRVRQSQVHPFLYTAPRPLVPQRPRTQPQPHLHLQYRCRCLPMHMGQDSSKLFLESHTCSGAQGCSSHPKSINPKSIHSCIPLLAPRYPRVVLLAAKPDLFENWR